MDMLFLVLTHNVIISNCVVYLCGLTFSFFLFLCGNYHVHVEAGLSVSLDRHRPLVRDPTCQEKTILLIDLMLST